MYNKFKLNSQIIMYKYILCLNKLFSPPINIMDHQWNLENLRSQFFITMHGNHCCIFGQNSSLLNETLTTIVSLSLISRKSNEMNGNHAVIGAFYRCKWRILSLHAHQPSWFDVKVQLNCTENCEGCVWIQKNIWRHKWMGSSGKLTHSL